MRTPRSASLRKLHRAAESGRLDDGRACTMQIFEAWKARHTNETEGSVGSSWSAYSIQEGIEHGKNIVLYLTTRLRAALALRFSALEKRHYEIWL